VGEKEQFLEGRKEAQQYNSFPAKKMPHFITQIEM